jgi:predicted acetyltransferase
MIELRPGRPDDIRAVAELWLHAFPAPRSLEDRISILETGGRHGGIETVHVATDQGRLLGAMKTIPFTQYVNGDALPMMGLAAVGVAPWARRRGIGAALCGEALRVGVERGDIVSALYPFRPAFYERLGWGLAGELHAYRFRPESLPDMPDPGVRPADPADHRAIASCYSLAMQKSSGLIEREQVEWERLLSAPATHAFVCGSPVVTGYMIVRYGLSDRSPDRRTLWIREMVTDEGLARDRLFGWISRQRDLWRRVRYDASPDECFGLRLTDPRPPAYRPARSLWAETARVLRGPMFRILDVERAFSKRTHWGPAPALSLELTVLDPELPSNGGPWHLHFDGGEMRFGAAVPGSTSPKVSLRIEASALSQLYVGEISVSAAVMLGRAKLNGPAGPLDALFSSAARFRMLDEF